MNMTKAIYVIKRDEVSRAQPLLARLQREGIQTFTVTQADTAWGSVEIFRI